MTSCNATCPQGLPPPGPGFPPCQTNSGCIFPFTFMGRSYVTCTTAFGNGFPLCATSVVDETAMLTGWAYCEDSCPKVPPQTVPANIHPQNKPDKCHCGVPNFPTKKIVGGEMAHQAEFPWQVAILTGANVTAAQTCGGALVGSKYVVTAAHCTVQAGTNIPVSPETLNVGIGFTSLANYIPALDAGEVKIINVVAIRNHPGYTTTFEHDISVLELAQDINLYSHPNIKPICLPEAGANFDNAAAVISGWGRMDGLPGNPGDPNQVNVADLRDVTLKIYPYGECFMMNQLMAGEGQLCAGTYLGGRGACAGDSGGPLIAKSEANNGAATLVGAVSFGTAVCASLRRPAVYTNIGYYRDWLDAQMPDLATCQPPEHSNWIINVEPESFKETDPCRKNKAVYFKLLDKIAEVDNYEECADHCNQNESCEYFKYKPTRFCFLVKVEYKRRKKFYSGPRFCNKS